MSDRTAQSTVGETGGGNEHLFVKACGAFVGGHVISIPEECKSDLMRMRMEDKMRFARIGSGPCP